MLKSLIFYAAIAMILVIASIAMRRREPKQRTVRFSHRSRLTSDDTQ